MSEDTWLRFDKKAKISIIDCETYNLCLNHQVNRPWEVSVLKVEGETILEEVDVWVKWEDCKFKIGEGAARVTKFNQKEFDSKAIDPDTAFHKFWPILQWADHIIMHNGLRFDIYLLKGYAEYMGEKWDFLTDKIIDTKAIAQGIKLGRPYKPESDNWMDYQYQMSFDHTKGIKTNLTALGKEYGIPFDYESLHRSSQDVKLNLLVWNHLKYQLEK